MMLTEVMLQWKKTVWQRFLVDKYKFWAVSQPQPETTAIVNIGSWFTSSPLRGYFHRSRFALLWPRTSIGNGLCGLVLLSKWFIEKLYLTNFHIMRIQYKFTYLDMYNAEDNHESWEVLDKLRNIEIGEDVNSSAFIYDRDHKRYVWATCSEL